MLQPKRINFHDDDEWFPCKQINDPDLATLSKFNQMNKTTRIFLIFEPFIACCQFGETISKTLLNGKILYYISVALPDFWTICRNYK